jgi:hypothetical protein
MTIATGAFTGNSGFKNDQGLFGTPKTSFKVPRDTALSRKVRHKYCIYASPTAVFRVRPTRAVNPFPVLCQLVSSAQREAKGNAYRKDHC